MKYKICRKEFKDLKVKICSNGKKTTELKRELKYFAKRKGRIFGFWHDCDEESCDYEGGTFIITEYFDTPQECEDFVKKFHEYHFGKDNQIEIINEIEL